MAALALQAGQHTGLLTPGELWLQDDSTAAQGSGQQLVQVGPWLTLSKLACASVSA